MSTELVFVYTTLPDQAKAQLIAEDLVRERLAACVNIYPPMISIYEWEGKLDATPEVACFIKTRAALVSDVMDALRKRHPYSVPAMLVLPVVDGNSDYMSWVREQTRR